MSGTRTRARAPGEEDYPPSTAVHWRVTDPTLSGIFVDTNAMHEGRKQTNTGPAHAGSRLKLTDALGRRRPKCHPSSRTGENPPYGMIGGIEETSASCEARTAPRSYPTLPSGLPHLTLPNLDTSILRELAPGTITSLFPRRSGADRRVGLFRPAVLCRFDRLRLGCSGFRYADFCGPQLGSSCAAFPIGQGSWPAGRTYL